MVVGANMPSMTKKKIQMAFQLNTVILKFFKKFLEISGMFGPQRNCYCRPIWSLSQTSLHPNLSILIPMSLSVFYNWIHEHFIRFSKRNRVITHIVSKVLVLSCYSDSLYSARVARPMRDTTAWVILDLTIFSGADSQFLLFSPRTHTIFIFYGSNSLQELQLNKLYILFNTSLIIVWGEDRELLTVIPGFPVLFTEVPG